tara:strand:- start:204 stop:518 length:315 start_codon:yes stop_codon:yes gene_type:complete
MDANLTLKLVQSCIEVIENQPSFLTDSSNLPCSKETAKRAIQILWFATEDLNIKHRLKHTYIRLADFQPDVKFTSKKQELENLRRSEQRKLQKDVTLWERDEFE